MGRFDGILLATDFDGTFYHNNELFEENLKAIKYFQENGGKFTFCSGRYYHFFKQFEKDVMANTYMICYNGALIINPHDGEILHKGFCDEYLFDILERLITLDLKYKFIAFYDDENEAPMQYTMEEFVRNIDKFKKKKNIYKVLLRAQTEKDAEVGVRAVNRLELGGYIARRSWAVSLEIQKKENGKGAAIRRLAEKLGSRLVVAVGDYENDIDMIEAADIGYAVENAIDILKEKADRITVGVTESAIAKIIYELDAEINNEKA